MSEFSKKCEEYHIKNTYPQLKELYDSDPQWKKDFSTFEDFVDWAQKVKILVDECQYLLAREDKK